MLNVCKTDKLSLPEIRLSRVHMQLAIEKLQCYIETGFFQGLFFMPTIINHIF